MTDFLRRIPRYLLVVVGLFVGLEAVSGGLVGFVRATHPHYACLYFYPGRVVDLATGFDIADRRPLPVRSVVPPGQVSPDGKYKASVQTVGQGKSALIALPLAGDGQPIVLEDAPDGVATTQYDWAPVAPANTSRIAWVVGGGHAALSVADLGATGLLQKLVKPLNNQLAFGQWSPDGAYFVFAVLGEGALRLWSMADQREVTYPLPGILEQLTWAPSADQFAYLHDDLQSSRLTIATPGANSRAFDLNSRISDARLIWSPGERYVAVTYVSNWPRYHIDLFGVDGSSFDVADVAHREDMSSMAVWSPDGQALLFMQDRPSGAWNWMAFYPTRNRYETLVPDLITSPAYAPGSPRIAVHWRDESGKQNVAVMDVDGAHRAMLVEDADDVGDPYWSPDGQRVAVVWATGQQSARVVRLTIARQDGSGLVTLADHFWDARDLRWLPDSKTLAFVAWRGDARDQPSFSIEVADLEASQLRRLADGLAQVSMFGIDSRSGGIAYWWRTDDGAIGADSYMPDGTRLYRFRADASAGATIDGELMQGDYWIAIQPGSPQVFMAPDGSLAALKLGPLGRESLQLASSDGTWTRLIRSDLSGLGDPLWSPDGRMVAFTQAVAGKPITLSVVRADGSAVRDIDQFPGTYGELTWTKCD